MSTSPGPDRPVPEAAPDEVEALLGLVAEVRERLDEATAVVDGLYAMRLDLFQKLRGRTPPVTQRRIAEASGISEVAVIQTLRAARKRAGEAAERAS